MMNRNFLAAVLITLISAAPALAAKPSGASSFFRGSELSPDVALCGRQFHVPTVLGPTGMNGWIFNNVLVVREVESGSPADGIALPNDIIQSVNGKALGSEPLKTLGMEIETAERTGKLAVQVLRAGAKKDLVIPIRKLGALSKDWPFNCAKSRAIHIDACEYLARTQNTDGTFDGKIHVGFALNGLTWLASDDPKYLEHARRLAYGYRKYFDPEGTSTTNWGWGYMGMFLAEYYLKTGDRTILPICETVAQTLAQSQMPCGSWGHGPYPGLGYVQGGNLNNCGLVCWMAMVLIKETGAEVNETALARATKFFSRFAFRGTVPYGDHRPEFGGGNGKNAIPGVCFNILGEQAKSEYFARMVTGSYRGRTGGHTGGFMGFVWGNVQGAQNPHYPDYRRMLDHWTWLMNVSRRWDGGFLLPESIIGHIYTYRGPVLATGGMAQVYAMPGARLRIHGGPKSVFASQDLPENIAKGVEMYQRREFDQLRKTVKPTSDLARQLLSAADAKQQDLKLTLARIETAMLAGELAGATQMTKDLARYTGGGRDLRIGGIRWRINTHKNASALEKAARLYEQYKWLTYTHPKARKAFEKLAADPKAGPYQALARRELATPPDASLWTFYSELLYKDNAETWRIDDKSLASMLRVSGIRSGNWTQIASLNTLYEASVLTDLLKENWTALAGACSKGYPGKKPPWRMLGVARGQSPPDGWTAIDFDDSKWTAGAGPISGRGDEGMHVTGGANPYLRIAFDCERTDYKSVVLTLRLLRGSQAVAFLNGKCILWANPTQGPRMRMNALVTIDLPPATIKLLRKGRNVLAVRVSSGQGADFGLYATSAGESLGFTPRPADWAPGVKMLPPELSTKTAQRREFKTALAPVTTGLAIDVPGKPNDSISPIRADFIGARGTEPERKTPLDQRAKYLGHVDSRIRRDAAYSLMADGAKAMPYILKALDSQDIRVIRAACDALGGNYRMNGRGMNNLREAMTTEIAGRAVPKLIPLLKHEDAYIREGALMALANCGKAAAPHLDKITALANDEEWWVRAGVAYVLGYVQEPETKGKADGTIEAFTKEQSIFARNRFLESLVSMAKRGHNTDAIVKALIEETKHPHGFYSSTAMSALGNIGYNAKAAAPLFEAKLAEAKEQLAAAKSESAKKKIERNIRSLQSKLNAMTSAPKPPRPPRKKKKK
jgi:HEAT repeat protein